MAAVEKRKHPLLSLLGNHLMFSVLCFFIVVQMQGAWQMAFGTFFFLLYISGIYSYAHRAATEQSKSYSTVRPHVKFPVAYALIALGYFLIPILLYDVTNDLTIGLITMVFDAQFVFGNFLADGNILYTPVIVFSVILVAMAFLGYLAGVKGFRIAPKINKMLYKNPTPKKQPKKKQPTSKY